VSDAVEAAEYARDPCAPSLCHSKKSGIASGWFTPLDLSRFSTLVLQCAIVFFGVAPLFSTTSESLFSFAGDVHLVMVLNCISIFNTCPGNVSSTEERYSSKIDETEPPDLRGYPHLSPEASTALRSFFHHFIIPISCFAHPSPAMLTLLLVHPCSPQATYRRRFHSMTLHRYSTWNRQAEAFFSQR
jgi:hypothetical protein